MRRMKMPPLFWHLFVLIALLPDSAPAQSAPPPIALVSPSFLSDLLPESFTIGLSATQTEVPTSDGSLFVRSSDAKIRFALLSSKEGPRIGESSPHLVFLEWKGTLKDVDCEIPQLELSFQSGINSVRMERVRVQFPGSHTPILFQAQIQARVASDGLSLDVDEIEIRFPRSKGSDPLLEVGRLLLDGKPLHPENEIRKILIRSAIGLFRKHQEKIEKKVASLTLNTLKERLSSFKKTYRLEAPASENPLRGFSLEWIPNQFHLGNPNTLLSSLLPVLTIPDLHGSTSRIAWEPSLPPLLSEVPPLPPRSAGFLLPEGVLQKLLAAPEVQERIRMSLVAPETSPGVSILPHGVQIRLLHEEQAVSVLIPLEIDLIRTLAPTSPPRERFRIALGDWIESWFGSGKTVKVPVEIQLLPNLHEKQITLHVRLPFSAEGDYRAPGHCAPEICPSNVERMSKRVRRILMRRLFLRFSEQIPTMIRVPAGPLKNLKITPNSSLFITLGAP
jgi:hypothetical protein